MVNGYYDYHPQVIPDRPIAITGFMGARVSPVGASVSALTGLTLYDLDRLVEHEAGSTISYLVIQESEAAMRELESKLLERSLLSEPPGIIALGEGALLTPSNRQLVQERATLVYLELSVDELLTQLRKELAESPGKYFHLFPDLPERVEDLEPFLKERLPFYRKADITVDATAKHPTQLAQEIIHTLGLTT